VLNVQFMSHAIRLSVTSLQTITINNLLIFIITVVIILASVTYSAPCY